MSDREALVQFVKFVLDALIDCPEGWLDTVLREWNVKCSSRNTENLRERSEEREEGAALDKRDAGQLSVQGYDEAGYSETQEEIDNSQPQQHRRQYQQQEDLRHYQPPYYTNYGQNRYRGGRGRFNQYGSRYYRGYRPY